MEIFTPGKLVNATEHFFFFSSTYLVVTHLPGQHWIREKKEQREAWREGGKEGR